MKQTEADVQRVKYKYIHFLLIEEKPKTSVWYCRNNKSDAVLGMVQWYGPWRQYCYFPSSETVYNAGCLADIEQFMGIENAKRK